jgi:glycosyltransferase involved in cell wall biosynthesis
MKLSVIIPCLNGAATLAVQLEALSIQEWSEKWELIISDNGSTDNSIEIAQQYKNKFYAFKIVDSSNRRSSPYAINNAVTEASSDNIAVCDADDEVAPGWVAAIGTALDKYEVVCGRFKFDKFNGLAEAERAAKAWETGFFVGKFLPGGGSGNYGIKKKIHQRIGGFDECLPHAADADYFWRLQLEGYKLHSVPDAVIQVRLGRVNPTVSYMFRRARNRAASNYWCYKRYKQYGMLAPIPIKKAFVDWLVFLKTGLRIVLRKNNNKLEWLLKFAQKSGSLVGEIQGRLTNPCKSFVPSKKIE